MKFDCSLYLVADTGTTERRKLDKKVELAIRGGCTMVQLREKNGNMKEFYHDAAALRRITDTYGIPLIINDRLDLMLAIDAPGIHVGQSDMPASVVRRLIGAEKLWVYPLIMWKKRWERSVMEQIISVWGQYFLRTRKKIRKMLR